MTTHKAHSLLKVNTAFVAFLSCPPLVVMCQRYDTGSLDNPCSTVSRLC